MKKILFLALGVLLFATCQPQKEKPNAINIGTIETLHSKILNEDRKVWVYVPHGLAESLEDKKTYPVLYVLDGDDHFQSVVGMSQKLSHMGPNSLSPEMIVVGIPNTDRTRDLTPSQDTTFAKTSGGGEAFAKFIEEELFKYIDSKYPTTPYRTLIGHSFGGIAAINMLVHHPTMFNNYLAIDPSLWWDNHKLMKEAEAFLDTAKLDGKTLYVAIANTLPKGKVLADLDKDTASNDHMRSIIRFCESRKNKANGGLLFGSKYYPEDNHGTVPFIAAYDAIRFWFPWFQYNEVYGFMNADSTVTSVAMVDSINAHYAIVSNHFGYAVHPPHSIINMLGNDFLANKKNDKALACFNLNLQNWPDNRYTYHSLGDYYVATKDTASAIENYKKVLSIKLDTDVKQKLERLAK